MNRRVGSIRLQVFLLLATGCIQTGMPVHGAASPTTPGVIAATQPDISFRMEIQHSIDLGLAWLTAHQNTNGWWHDPEYPGITALALTAFSGDPRDRYRGEIPRSLQLGYDYLLGCVKADGSISRSDVPVYNTSLSMMALVTANRPQYDPILHNARKFLASVQHDFGAKGLIDTPFDGGFGYGFSDDASSDLSNTLMALEAMRQTRYLDADRPASESHDLNWAAVIQFLQNCQQLPSHNQAPWVSGDATNLGGFIYLPGASSAGSFNNSATGRVTLRSYASISYVGLMSYLYADLDRADPRVTAVADWLRRNYTVEENPGMGAQGLYYYYHMMTKALAAAHAAGLPLEDGRMVNWRRELTLKLMALQRPDGSWKNDNPRWWENHPELSTSYVLLALERLWRTF